MNWKVILKCLKIAKQIQIPNDSFTGHFSFLVKKNSIDSVGWNNKGKTHTIAYKLNYKYPTIHSELACILNYNKNPSKHYMVNIRIGKSGNVLLSKPCKNCRRLLKHYNISKVIYSTDFGFSNWESYVLPTHT